MQDWLEALLLGIVQGLTEFLPVSSSGHLEIFRFLLGDSSTAEVGLIMSVVLHFGTALATVFVFRKDIYSILHQSFQSNNDGRKYIGWIVISMIPAALAGIFFDDLLESFFDQNMVFVGAMLFVTAGLLWISDRKMSERKPLHWKSVLIMGVAQAFAILPGISRSGATISTALLLKIDRTEAARFSFLMVVPLIFGKMAKDLMDGSIANADIQLLPLIVGFGAAFVAGAVACQWMLSIVRNAKLKYFGIYCLLIGALAISSTLVW